jgi:hypothetical protein
MEPSPSVEQVPTSSPHRSSAIGSAPSLAELARAHAKNANRGTIAGRLGWPSWSSSFAALERECACSSVARFSATTW